MNVKTKIARVLTALAEGRRLHRFIAEGELHDHTLPSTVSSLQRYGIQVDRRMITVPGYRGESARVAEYHLSDEERQKAWRVLREWERHGA